MLALAPMAGITNLAWRLICKNNGADVVYSEMVSADGLAFENKKTLLMLKTVVAEQPLVIQLFGKDPSKMAQAVKIINRTKVAGIDLNFGCPAQKVIRHGGGASLMKNLELCRKIIQTACEVSIKPVSLKLRTSINHLGKKITALDFLQKIADLPVAAIMIHGRTYEQGFVGDIDCQAIRDSRKYFKGLILANGGLMKPEDALKILSETKADGLGLARGTYGQPWIFQEIKDLIDNQKYISPDWKLKKKIILEHAKLAFKYDNDHGLLEMRKHLLWYVKGLPNASAVRQEIIKVTSLSEIKKVLDNI